jgi:membrane carboxypeptidase/penicillin-binding protein PbpC
MYDFLTNSLGFKPIQPIENYELGIALGALEMDLLTLSHYFTMFPNEGILKPLTIKIDKSEFLETPMGPEMEKEKRVSEKKFTQLVNKILSDRESAVEQFGMKSNLTLGHKHYALKTGTSRDFHDSWTIGYTPDFLVGVWLGNSDNTPMRQITGQTGAGKIWHEVMEVLLNSSYNQKTPFHFDAIKEFTESGTLEYGLPGDDYHIAKLLLKEPSLITHPHNKDVFLYDTKTLIPLRAEKSVKWFINNSFIKTSDEISWHPPQPGLYTITARDGEEKEKNISVRVADEE